MKISVVIATLHRENDLQILLESFLHQIIKPFEIIIVDQSDNDNTKNLCNDYQYKLPLKYHHFSIKSTTTTRNFGVKQAKGDVIAFLDDDTKLMPDYLYHIEEFYKEYPNAIGGMGKILNPNPMADRLIEKGFLKKISQFVGVIFGLHSFKKEFIVLKSGHNMMPHEITDVIKVEWLTGCCFWLKQNVFNEFQFEEKFVKWAYGEDKLLSYQIYKKYPNTLYYYPKAQLYHYESPKARLQGEEKIILKTIYHFWFFYKCINKNYFFFWWRNLGEFMLYFVSACLGKEFFINSWYYLKSNCILIKNLKIIKKGDFKQFIK